MKHDFNIQFGCGCKKGQAESQSASVSSQTVKTPSKPTISSITKPTGK